MKYSITTPLLFALFSGLGLSAPTLSSRQLSLQQIADASNSWAADTSRVSQFLSEAPGLTGQDLVNKASAALMTAMDEPVEKSILDSEFVTGNNPVAAVQQAESVLAARFGFVVAGLTDIVNNGLTFDTDDVNAAINGINANRCEFVLPSIDAYFQAASAVLQNGLTLVANRPNNCP
jgi:hypothetical protein